MQSLNFNEGYKEFCINGDETRVVRFNPSDMAFVERFYKALNNIEKEIDKIDKGVKIDANGDPVDGLKESAEIIEKARLYTNEQVDFIFNAKVSEIAFGNQSPLSRPGGITLAERFLKTLATVINETAADDEKKYEKHISKYKSQVYRK